MKLLFRLLGVLVLAAGRLLLLLLVTIFQILLLPILIIAFRLLQRLIFFAFTAIVNNPRQYINRLAGEWTERIHEGSVNRNHMNEVFQFCRFLVGAIVVLGWLVAGVFTYLLFRVAYGFFI